MPKRCERGTFLTVVAILFAALALSNASKALQFAADPSHMGLVIFGWRFESVLSNLILGPLLGAVLACYAYGLWALEPWVLPLSIGTALYLAYHRDKFAAG